MPGLPEASFLGGEPYQGIAPPTIQEDDEDDLTNMGAATSRFDQFSSPSFAIGAGLGPGANRLPTGGDEAIRRRGAVDTSREEEWVFDEFGKDGFDLAAYVKKTLTGADEEEKKRFRAALERYKQQNAKEMQRSVFKQ
jgi:hypothetical protein